MTPNTSQSFVVLVHITKDYLICSKEHTLSSPHCAIYMIQQVHLETMNLIQNCIV